MIELKDVTIICVDTYNYGKGTAALKKCLEQVKPAKCLFLTDIPIKLDGIEIIQIPTINNKDEYSHFIVKELYKYFDTSHCLLIQHDGHILDGSCWDNDFLKYDYIGALWPETDNLTCGNGGFSLRSKKLQTILATDENILVTNPEDVSICRLYRRYLEQIHNLKWATDEIANKFSYELIEPNQPTFGFHGNFHQPYKPFIILKRTIAIGDIVLMEPVMLYFYRKGYNVVLDIPLMFFFLFKDHYFPVRHISQFDRKRFIVEKEIDLDGAYESKPYQPYLKSYFEVCGINDYELTKPVLFPFINEKTKLFKKYAVIHIDERDTPHRNVFDIDWNLIKNHLESLGYVVIQVGNRKHEIIGIEINTTNNLGLLKFVIGGCDLFIGVDSGPAHIAVAYNTPSILFFGSVNPDFIHVDRKNIEIIQNACDRAGCWHIPNGINGQACYYNVEKPPCCIHDSDKVINAINRLI